MNGAAEQLTISDLRSTGYWKLGGALYKLLGLILIAAAVVYLLVDKKLLRSLFDTRLRNIGFRYATDNGQYVLIGLRPPVFPKNSP